MPKPTLNYRGHREKWNSCTSCSLCETRRNVVLARGKLPCDVLFIGEAPGASEDTIGQPFIGPAGKLLDSMIASAIGATGQYEVRVAFTNLIACIPIDDGSKVGEPPKEAVLACRPRLEEFLAIAKPSSIVRVGEHARKRLNEQEKEPNSNLRGITDIYSIRHPAAILRADISQRSLLVQQVVAQLTDVFERLVPF